MNDFFEAWKEQSESFLKTLSGLFFCGSKILEIQTLSRFVTKIEKMETLTTFVREIRKIETLTRFVRKFSKLSNVDYV